MYMFAYVCICMYCMYMYVYVYVYDFGFGRLSGFFGHISFYHPHKVWFLLAALSIRNLDLDSGSKMMSYSFQDDLSVLQTLPDSLH